MDCGGADGLETSDARAYLSMWVMLYEAVDHIAALVHVVGLACHLEVVDVHGWQQYMFSVTVARRPRAVTDRWESNRFQCGLTVSFPVDARIWGAHTNQALDRDMFDINT